MTDKSMMNMGPVKSAATSGGKMRDTDKVHMNEKPAVKAPSKSNQMKSGGPGVGGKGGMSHAVSTLSRMKP